MANRLRLSQIIPTAEHSFRLGNWYPRINSDLAVDRTGKAVKELLSLEDVKTGIKEALFLGDEEKFKALLLAITTGDDQFGNPDQGNWQRARKLFREAAGRARAGRGPTQTASATNKIRHETAGLLLKVVEEWKELSTRFFRLTSDFVENINIVIDVALELLLEIRYPGSDFLVKKFKITVSAQDTEAVGTTTHAPAGGHSRESSGPASSIHRTPAASTVSAGASGQNVGSRKGGSKRALSPDGDAAGVQDNEHSAREPQHRPSPPQKRSRTSTGPAFDDPGSTVNATSQSAREDVSEDPLRPSSPSEAYSHGPLKTAPAPASISHSESAQPPRQRFAPIAHMYGPPPPSLPVPLASRAPVDPPQTWVQLQSELADANNHAKDLESKLAKTSEDLKAQKRQFENREGFWTYVWEVKERDHEIGWKLGQELNQMIREKDRLQGENDELRKLAGAQREYFERQRKDFERQRNDLEDEKSALIKSRDAGIASEREARRKPEKELAELRDRAVEDGQRFTRLGEMHLARIAELEEQLKEANRKLSEAGSQ